MHYHGHRQRLKSRLKDSPEKLMDYEVLELLLGYAILRRDTKPIAKDLLERYETLRGVLDAKPENNLDIPGYGQGVCDFFHTLQEFFSRYAESRVRNREELCSPEAVAGMARQRLGKLPHEEVWVAYVDNRNRLISWEKAATGSINASAVHPRDIMEKALEHKASGFIIVHNHPGGNATPSNMDLDFTHQTEKAARTLFIRFLDHVIVCDSSAYSIMNNKYL